MICNRVFWTALRDLGFNDFGGNLRETQDSIFFFKNSNMRKNLHEFLALVNKAYIEYKAVAHFDMNTSPVNQLFFSEDITGKPDHHIL